MIAYIQTDKHGECYNVNAYVAWEGFTTLGFETRKFFRAGEIEDNDPAPVVVGGVGTVRERLKALGIALPSAELEYPESLQPWLGRKIWQSTIGQVLLSGYFDPVFVKPVETKLFPGKVIRKSEELLKFQAPPGTRIWCSEILNLQTEWRCFIRYGKILDIRRYTGAWGSRIDPEIVREAVAAFKDAPAAYSLDFGVDDTGKHYLVEVNDGHSLGTYGLSSLAYAKFLSARWAELTNTEDPLGYLE